MNAFLNQWLELILRWIHVFAGIMWVGATFYFTWLDGRFTELEEHAKKNPDDKNPEKFVWMVHSGGFYLVEKQKNPKLMTQTLHWLKWEAAITWLSGFLLFALMYYHRGNLIDFEGAPISKVIYGEGLTFKGGSHGAILKTIPEDAEKDLKLPVVPKSPSNHFKNFLLAAKGQEKCRSSFAIAGPLCQTLALGIIAQRVNAKLEFDAVKKQITNHAVANSLLVGPPPRKGWEQFYKV